MGDNDPYPRYLQRGEERHLLDEVARVRADGQSRAVLLYGPGGVGKTSMVRRLAEVHEDDRATAWLWPVDIDDSEYWLLSNLEQYVANGLDPKHHYFRDYLEHRSRLPVYTRPRIGYETVVSHLAQINQVFADCYRRFTEGSGMCVVITLDTVEAIRGVYLLHTLTQWMKSLPATLFILAGRPVGGSGQEGKEIRDPIEHELADPHRPLPARVIRLGEFSKQAALDYLAGSAVAAGLRPADREPEKLVHLTRGHPLWLAFTVDYLRNTGVPAEAENPLDVITGSVPYQGALSSAGQALHEGFMRHLVAPYQETDFWHEALKRLAVVRESISKDAWQLLMADREPPAGMSLADTWDALGEIPWIRPRANRRYVTLHDAVAEELAQRIIPVHDEKQDWRYDLWRKAEEIYAGLSAEREATLRGDVERLDDELQSASPQLAVGAELPAGRERDLIENAEQLELQRRELSQLKAIRLCYRLLCDPTGGCEQFLDLMEQAKRDHDALFQDLLAAEIQRFLPSPVPARGAGDVVGEAIGKFREWLTRDGQALHIDVGVSLADHLIRAEKPAEAFDLLATLPAATASPSQRYRLANLRGNTCMRMPEQIRQAETHFTEALAEATALQSEEGLRLVAKAHKELGFYYRNIGRWDNADKAYAMARDAISTARSAGQPEDENREEMASILSNWAYVKGLTGDYRAGTNLAQSAITVRRRLGNRQDEGSSWSVLGEVYRYERRFHKAWDAYAEAERIFQELRNWAWIGQVRQEQAVCLLQAHQEKIDLVTDPVAEAERLITEALDLCRDLAVRGYPSALNRAGRIYAERDFDTGLKYLADGITEGRRLSDGWFWFANMVERAELCYRAWQETGDEAYRAQIREHEADIAVAMDRYQFPDLEGRWDLLQGHLRVHHSVETDDESGLGHALEHYKYGFALIAKQYVGSSGAAEVAEEFRHLGELITKLSPQKRAEWQAALRHAWSGLESEATLLLAGLEELY